MAQLGVNGGQDRARKDEPMVKAHDVKSPDLGQAMRRDITA